LLRKGQSGMTAVMAFEAAARDMAEAFEDRQSM
jgi:hypothetical protein